MTLPADITRELLDRREVQRTVTRYRRAARRFGEVGMGLLMAGESERALSAFAASDRAALWALSTRLGRRLS